MCCLLSVSQRLSIFVFTLWLTALLAGEALENCDPKATIETAFSEKANLTTIRALIESLGGEAYLQDKYSVNLLELSARYGRSDVAGTLQIDETTLNNREGASPVLIAAQYGQTGFLEWIHRTFHVLDKANSSLKQDVLNRAVRFHKYETADYILSLRDTLPSFCKEQYAIYSGTGQNTIAWDTVDVNKNYITGSLLHIAARKGNVESATFLLSHGADVNLPDPESRSTPLHEAIQYSRLGVAKVLLEHSAKINLINSRKETPLELAVKNGDVTAAKLLIASSADVNTCSSRSLLGIAAVANNDEMILLLLQNNADPYLADNRKMVPIESLVMLCNSTILEKIVDSKATSYKDDDGNGLLYYAAWNGNVAAIEFLIDKGIGVNSVNSHNQTAINTTVSVPCGQYLLSHGADLSICNDTGISPLHHWAMCGSPDFIRELCVKLKVDARSMADKFGKTPIDYARERLRRDPTKYSMEVLAILQNSDNFKK